MSKLSKGALVEFDLSKLSEQYKFYFTYMEGKRFIFLGEILNKPGHCLVLDPNTKETYSQYHTMNFTQVKT